MSQVNEEKSARVCVLEDAARLTGEDRNTIYGDPSINFSCQARLIRTYATFAYDRQHSDPHVAAMQMVLAKIARIACGEFHRDNYVDAAAYLAIAYEVEHGYRELTSSE